MQLSRRAALLAGAAAGLGTLAACSSDLPSGVPDVDTGPQVSGSFASRYRHTDVGWTIAYPPGHDGGARLPVLVYLHPRGGNHNSAFGGSLHFDKFLADAVRHGMAPFAIAAADGGDHEYWHPRESSDPAGMIVHEFIPLLARHGLVTDRVGLMGNSMGGYGTLYLAETMGRARVAVAVAVSAAVWHRAEQTVEGAFDGPADFAAHSVFPRLHRLDGIPLRIDCGASDGFVPVTRDLRAGVHPAPAGGFRPGGHDTVYWRREAPSELRFVGRHLGRR